MFVRRGRGLLHALTSGAMNSGPGVGNAPHRVDALPPPPMTSPRLLLPTPPPVYIVLIIIVLVITFVFFVGVANAKETSSRGRRRNITRLAATGTTGGRDLDDDVHGARPTKGHLSWEAARGSAIVLWGTEVMGHLGVTKTSSPIFILVRDKI